MPDTGPPRQRSRQSRTPAGPLLDRRTLNRAFLARQMLLERQPDSALEAIEHLLGLQSQAPAPPYVALWTRLAAFQPESLSRLLLDRAVVRIALMRGTIYLVTAADALTLRPFVQAAFERGGQPALREALAELDLARVRQSGRAHLEEHPRTWEELGRLLAAEWPDRDPAALAQVLRNQEPLVQVPPRGLWRQGGPAAHTTVEAWLGQSLAESPPVEAIVRRYLAAYGPATVADAQAWAGVVRLAPVFERLRPELVTFSDETGRELFDLPGAPRPDPGTPAPPRFLAEFDTALLSHKDRSRIITDAQRRAVFTINGIVQGTVLADGFVAGIWKIAAKPAPAVLTIEELTPLSAGVRASLEDEGRRLLAFSTGDPAASEVRFITR